MSAIGGSGPVDPTQWSSQPGTTDANKAAQMEFVLGLLKALTEFEDSTGGAGKLQQTFQAELKQHPLPLQTMQKQLNEVITNINQALSGNIPSFPLWTGADSSDTGQSFMHFLLSFAQFAAGASGGNTDLENQVGQIASYNGHWSPAVMYEHLTNFLSALNSATLASPFGEMPFSKIEIPLNFF
jgi:hypothetical protein